MKRRYLYFSLLATLPLLSCVPASRRGAASKPAPVVSSPGSFQQPDRYLDLEAGWRLRAVMGLRRNGVAFSGVIGPGFAIRSAPKGRASQAPTSHAPTSQNGPSLTIEATGDFLGFATDYYSVAPASRGGVRVRFASGERSVEGKLSTVQKPATPLFAIPPPFQRVRLLYLLDASAANHSMAILAARRADALEQFTREVQADPGSSCRSTMAVYCEWVAAGIAVRAEKPGQGTGGWVPVR